jgi:UDP-xylose:glucoside alpha-1,3-xylosyltransferase
MSVCLKLRLPLCHACRPHTRIDAFVFADEENLNRLRELAPVTILPDQRSMHLWARPLAFPVGQEEAWKKLFKPCASQRLFLPEVLPTSIPQ